MTRNVFGALVIVFAISLPTWGAIEVSIPDLKIPYTETSSAFTVEAVFSGSYDVDSYSLLLKLVPQLGASGVTFNSASEASTDYIFTSSDGWFTVKDEPLEVGGDDGVPFGAPAETIADVTRNMITVQLAASLTAANIGDTYVVEFAGPGTTSSILDENFTPISGITWTPGEIEITDIPEPSSLVILTGLGLSSLVFFRRRTK